ncbi:MAG: hypothetical protein ACE5OZ_18850 [Candidatus Heimdallarchaeota archaeon]
MNRQNSLCILSCLVFLLFNGITAMNGNALGNSTNGVFAPAPQTDLSVRAESPKDSSTFPALSGNSMPILPLGASGEPTGTFYQGHFDYPGTWSFTQPEKMNIDTSTGKLGWQTDTSPITAHDAATGITESNDIIEFEYHYLSHGDGNTRQQVNFGFTDDFPFVTPTGPGYASSNYIGGYVSNVYGAASFSIVIIKDGTWVYWGEWTVTTPTTFWARIHLLDETNINVTVIKDETTTLATVVAAGNATGIPFNYAAVWNQQRYTNYPIQGAYQGELNYLVYNKTRDPTIPVIDHPADITFEEATPGHSITWHPRDQNPHSYVLYQNETIIQAGGWTGGNITVSLEDLSVGLYNYTLVVNDTYGNQVSDIVWVTIYIRLTLQLSGEFDYKRKEPIHVQAAALVTDNNHHRPISGADVNLSLYYPEGPLVASAMLLEKTETPGVYLWRSPRTLEQMDLPFGIYLAYFKASIGGGPSTIGILQLHYDPPSEEASSDPLDFDIIALLMVPVAAIAGYWCHRHKKQA